MFSSVEHEKYFIVSGPGCELQTKVSAGKTECTVTELPWLLKAHLLCSSCSQHFSSKLNIHKVNQSDQSYNTLNKPVRISN